MEDQEKEFALHTMRECDLIEILESASKCHRALAALVRMIDRSNPIDDHGHPLKNSIVFLKAKEFVGEK